MRHADVDPLTGPVSSRPTRYFTVHQANRALVLVRRIVEDIVRQYARLNEMQEWMDVAERQGRHEESAAARGGLLALAEEVWGYLEELDEIGVELRDPARGVVDFPFRRDGRELRLCWQFGEPQVAHWHEAEAEFTERLPLEAMLAKKVAPPSFRSPVREGTLF